MVPIGQKRLSAWWFGTFGLFFHLLGTSSSQQTIRPSFFRGVAQNHQAVMKHWDLVGPSSSRSDDSTTLDGHSDHSIDWWSSPCGHRDSARWTFHHLWSLWEVLGCWDFPAPQMSNPHGFLQKYRALLVRDLENPESGAKFLGFPSNSQTNFVQQSRTKVLTKQGRTKIVSITLPVCCWLTGFPCSYFLGRAYGLLGICEGLIIGYSLVPRHDDPGGLSRSLTFWCLRPQREGSVTRSISKSPSRRLNALAFPA